MVQRTYYGNQHGRTWSWWGRPPADSEPDVPTNDLHTVNWGYNLADIDRLARVAATRSFGASTSVSDRYDTAFSAIAEYILTAESRPGPRAVLNAGSTAVVNQAAQEWHHHGYSRKRDDTQVGFVRYWRWTASPTPSPEGRVVERVALWQIWARLGDSYRATLLAFAASEGDLDAAARRMGISRDAAKCRVQRARAAFMWLWHEGEAPTQTWRATYSRGLANDNRLGRPRLTAAQTEQVRDRVWAGETYAAIAADFGVGIATISRVVRGVVAPAPDRAE